MTEIISTGYAGAPRGIENCIDRGSCRREELEINPGDRYDLCRSVHAEMNAIIHAARRDMIGGRLFLAGVDVPTGELKSDADACRLCKYVIINAGIEYVYVLIAPDKFRKTNVRKDWIDRQHEVLDLSHGPGY
jgi:dCMP deaminase